MDLIHVEHLVVLAPGLLCAALGGFIHAAAMASAFSTSLRRSVQSLLTTTEHVETAKDFAVSAAFTGPAGAILLGITVDSTEGYYLGAAVFLAAMFVSMRLSKLLVELNKRDESTAHRKAAGTTRSIVQSELRAAASRQVARLARPRTRRLRAGIYSKNLRSQRFDGGGQVKRCRCCCADEPDPRGEFGGPLKRRTTGPTMKRESQ